LAAESLFQFPFFFKETLILHARITGLLSFLTGNVVPLTVLLRSFMKARLPAGSEG
jgi:hypothetical protein